MEMTGEQLIHASQADTWAALNDTEYVVQMTARVGPVSAKFKGKLTLTNMNPPHSYSIAFEGQGGVAGFAKGSADVNLTPEGGSTKLAYKVKANVGGKLAQIGSRLVDAAANKVANDFFVSFNEKVGKPRPEAAEDHHDEHHPEPVARDP